MVLENGRPPSRANDHSWRDEVAITLMTPEMRTTMIMVVITLVAV
jgi:hypothetical protein